MYDTWGGTIRILGARGLRKKLSPVEGFGPPTHYVVWVGEPDYTKPGNVWGVAAPWRAPMRNVPSVLKVAQSHLLLSKIEAAAAGSEATLYFLWQSQGYRAAAASVGVHL